MFGFVRGTALAGGVVLTSGGIGLALQTATPLCEGDEVSLWVTTQVRQDAIVCYGFTSRDEQQLFGALVKVQGVGPSAAMALLGTVGVAGVVGAVDRGDLAALRRAPGVGAAAAQRILANLKLPAGLAEHGTGASTLHVDVLATLENLGFDAQAARQALTEAGEEGSTEDELLAGALTRLRAVAR
jgi:Holliday junction DNA helicase RuvA